MNHLLAVSAELLDGLGLEAFNTNILADRASIGTRAIHRYFPKKFAILVKSVVWPHAASGGFGAAYRKDLAEALVGRPVRRWRTLG
jgi:AcrR family transcriptional regulator